ncbi:MAG: BrnT family toxin [Janthinobacterium lividum]
MHVFAGATLDTEDDRCDYGERRIVSVGYLFGRMVVIVWTPRGKARHIISMRKANDREQKRFAHRLSQA